MIYALILNKETHKAFFVRAYILEVIEQFATGLEGFEILVTLHKQGLDDDKLIDGVVILDGLQGVRYEQK